MNIEDFNQNEVFNNSKGMNTFNEKIRVKYNNNSIGAKNQTIIINKTDYDDEIYSLNFCSTMHLIQGLTLKNKIFINPNNLFTPNLLYVKTRF